MLILPIVVFLVVVGTVAESHEMVCKERAAGRPYTYRVIGGCRVDETAPREIDTRGGDL